MKSLLTGSLALGLVVALLAAVDPPASGHVQEKKEEKGEPRKVVSTVGKTMEPPVLAGKYVLVAGKVNDKPADEGAKTWTYIFTAETITITAPRPKKEEKADVKPLKFVFSYKLDAATTPIQIDMAILDGPEGTKGSKAAGILETAGETIKLAYTMEKDKRPKDFTGKEGNSFELKKMK